MNIKLITFLWILSMFVVFLWLGAEKWEALFSALFLFLLKDIRDWFKYLSESKV